MNCMIYFLNFKTTYTFLHDKKQKRGAQTLFVNFSSITSFTFLLYTLIAFFKQFSKINLYFEHCRDVLESR